ncbi:MAG: helix-turn-helix domain-containing protein [bacterium]
MKTDKYKNPLIDFGLSENEASVYISALKLGPTAILPLSRETGIRRTTVYTVIETLKLKGLISVELKGFKHLFVAAHPKMLSSIFESKKKKLEAIIPELTTIQKSSGSESVIRSYEGIASIRSLYENVLDTLRTDDFCYVVSDTEKFVEKDPDFFTDYMQRRARMKIDLKAMLRDSPVARERQKFAKNWGASIKILPANTLFDANFTVTNHILVIQDLSESSLAIATENKSYISLQKTLFETIWNSIPD